MTSRIQKVGALIAICAALAASGCKGTGGQRIEDLEQGAQIAGFRLMNLYENDSGKVTGARLVSTRHGFLVDLLDIQSVPQGFMWIKTVPWSDRGEAHACEHLLLGKGRQGRYVASLEEMTLGSSSAWTSQLNTVYHFNTLAGPEGFYKTLDARLRALLLPDFQDEEVRREVAHIGVAEDAESGALTLEEKGTVFTEMVSSFEGPGYPLWGTISDMLYGKDHPAANSSGGHPDSMRGMTAEHMWEFHKKYYRPANMGIIVALPESMDRVEFLERLGGILEAAWPQGDASQEIGMSALILPPAAAPTAERPDGEIRIVPYASENPEDPGRMLFAWPARRELGAQDAFLAQVFLESFAGDAGTPLYGRFINSETRTMDLGASSVWGYLSEDPGNPVFLGLSGVGNEHIDAATLARVRDLFIAELRALHDLPDGSPELAEFNAQAESRLESNRKSLKTALGQPPMFGFRRGTAGRWQSLLRELEREDGFRKSLTHADQFAEASMLIASGRNFWRDAIDRWGLLSAAPRGVGVFPSPDVLDANRRKKAERLEGFVAECRERYGEQDEQRAIAAYKAEFDATTAALEALSAGESIPRFIDSPPLTLDDELDYTLAATSNGVDLFAAAFENMSSTRLGLALRLDVLPAELLHLVPLLPAVLTEIGATKSGERVEFAEMRKRLRSELTDYSSYISSNPETGRVELVLRGTATGAVELENLLGWMIASLQSPNLDEANLPRLLDLVEQAVVGGRSRMQGSPESWVNDPAAAYRYQSDALFLSAESFLTQTHYYHRLNWLLRAEDDMADRNALLGFLSGLADAGRGLDRAGLEALLDSPPNRDAFPEDHATANEIVAALRGALPEIPDIGLTADWSYLCGQMAGDLARDPAETLAELREALALLLHADNARLFMVSNSADGSAALPGIERLAAQLSGDASLRVDHRGTRHVEGRLADRMRMAGPPLYVGLINNNTRNGVVMFSARNARAWDADPEKVLDAMAGKTYGGGGGHGLFMRTWAAGLAYSNGYSYRDATGLTSYYAERCPDVAQTMRFVAGIVADAKVDDELVEYAVALAFGQSRAAGPYESRGENMAEDLADGLGPEKVRAYREQVLALRGRKDLAAELARRVPKVYGQVIAGVGPDLAESEDGIFFLIGAESQFESFERYVASVESERPVFRLHPRDFWLVN